MNKKQRLRNQADKLWKQKIIENSSVCEVCNQEPTETGHHFFPKSNFGHLRYDLNNGIAIGRKCHFKHHHIGDPDIHHKIIKKRGEDWFTALQSKSRENPASYQTIGYYKDTIEKLRS